MVLLCSPRVSLKTTVRTAILPPTLLSCQTCDTLYYSLFIITYKVLFLTESSHHPSGAMVVYSPHCQNCRVICSLLGWNYLTLADYGVTTSAITVILVMVAYHDSTEFLPADLLYPTTKGHIGNWRRYWDYLSHSLLDRNKNLSVHDKDPKLQSKF